MTIEIGILVIRLVFGLAIAAHGAQKLFGSFGGYGLKGTGSFFEGLGFRPGTVFAAAAGFGEFGGGLLLALGLFTPLGAAAVVATMLVAMVSVHLKNGFFATGNGIELPVLYAAAAIGVAFGGAGSYSLDSRFGLKALSEPLIAVGILVLGVIGAAVSLGFRRQAAGQEAAAQS